MKPAQEVGALPERLTSDIDMAGYYPALVGDVVATALAAEPVISHLVHLETTFDRDIIRRHVTVLVLTESRLVIAHADDHADESGSGTGHEIATATTESIPLSAVRGVTLTHVVEDPQHYLPGSLGRELTLTLGWGAVSRLDLVPASCGDPACEADHGYEGSIAGDDIALRVSATAEGRKALDQATSFATALSEALSTAARSR